MLNVHCIAHRLALCTSQAADKFSPMKEHQEVLTSLYYYFKNSPARVDRLAAIHEVMESPQIRYKEVHAVRWLSFFNALEAVYRTLDPLLTYLAGVDAKKDPKAVHLKKKIGSAKFISLTYLLMDIIPVVSKLNLFFQKENLDISLVKVNLDHTVQDLEKLKSEAGPYQLQLQEDLQTNPTSFNGDAITACPQQHITSAGKYFIDRMVTNIKTRFPDTDILTAFGVLSLRPISYLSQEELKTSGNDQIQSLVEHYGQEKTHSWVEDGEEKSTTSKAIIDPGDTIKEWEILKEVVLAQMYPRDKTASLWELIPTYHKADFQTFSTWPVLL